MGATECGKPRRRLPIPPAGGKDAKGYPIGNDVTSDVAVRRAINYAIDRKLLADQLLEGHAIPAYSAVEGLPWLNKATAFRTGMRPTPTLCSTRQAGRGERRRSPQRQSARRLYPLVHQR